LLTSLRVSIDAPGWEHRMVTIAGGTLGRPNAPAETP
jgi:hypothetical protein